MQLHKMDAFIFVSIFMLLAIIPSAYANDLTGGLTYNEDFQSRKHINATRVLSTNQTVLGSGQLYLLNLIQLGFYPHGHQVIYGSGLTPVGKPITVNLPHTGKIMVRGLLTFTYLTGPVAPAVSASIQIDGESSGNTCYIPYDFTFSPSAKPRKQFATCLIGMPKSSPRLHPGNHSLQLHIQIADGPANSILINAGGEGDGYHNLEIYGYDYLETDKSACEEADLTWTGTSCCSLVTDSSFALGASPNPTNASDTHCCPENRCWDGNRCMSDQSNSSAYTLTQGYRCVGGKWMDGTPKFTPERFERGFCPKQTDCLWNPAGDTTENYKPQTYFEPIESRTEQPACIADGQHILDNLCDKGNWTTRTKAIALELLKLANVKSSSEYALFCGNHNDVLNFVEYDPSTLGIGSLRNYLEQTCSINGTFAECVNNFCALRYSGNKIAFGTSLNIPVDDPTEGFLNALGKRPDSCDEAAIDDGSFHECTTPSWTDKIIYTLRRLFGTTPPCDAQNQDSCPNIISYNHGLNAIISTPPDTTPTGAAITRLPPAKTRPALQYSQEGSINSPLTTLRAFANENPFLEPFYDPLANTTRFNNLFILKSPDRTYFGFLDKDVFFGEFIDIAALAYDGIDIMDPISGNNPCDMIKQKIPTENVKDFDCAYDRTTGRLRMIATSKTPQSGASKLPLRTFWRDMTAKIR